jgi:hypothetical protein
MVVTPEDGEGTQNITLHTVVLSDSVISRYTSICLQNIKHGYLVNQL